ncbi:GFA family protein [Pseudomonas sp. SA3-5]|uniref:GFA family protein n=1 Tax=Pseudomonas aestuarii TaxID=3018340 RepID=A0ABT4X9D4_9PSED|nr:GFA family protein [Pseudomonas aestuarii]MDA7084989.1 GFA family protein [Pseudomonas aestuarii]
MSDPKHIHEGGCSCRHVRYRMTATPLFVHACHCNWCQRESGSAFALNALIESSRVELLSGDVMMVDTPSASGKGQRIARCPRCHVALWSHYGAAGDSLCFVRVGSLDKAWRCPPDIHIHTASKLPWLVLPEDIPAVPGYYRSSAFWPAASLERMARLKSAPR